MGAGPRGENPAVEGQARVDVCWTGAKTRDEGIIHKIQWNLSIEDLRIEDTFLIRTLHACRPNCIEKFTRVSVTEWFHCNKKFKVTQT